MYLSVGSWLPGDFTMLHICSLASVWALMVQGLCLPRQGSGVHLVVAAVACRSPPLWQHQISVLFCMTVRYSWERQCGCSSPSNTVPRAGWRVCMWTTPGKQRCLAVQSSTDQQLLGEVWNPFWQHKMLWETVAKDAVGLGRPSD